MSIGREQPVTSTVRTRYETVIPAEIRERFMIAESTKIAWVVRAEERTEARRQDKSEPDDAFIAASARTHGTTPVHRD